jgi:L-seryl-tRNA(Ser) seleniumtransferase
VREDLAYVGGGSLPDQAMRTWVVELTCKQFSEQDCAYRLRMADPAIMGRLREGCLVLDVRTIFPEQTEELVRGVASVTGGTP